ncbi:MAG: hypothetical protein AAF438_18650 [Pseudomonadota bacterium]
MGRYCWLWLIWTLPATVIADVFEYQLNDQFRESVFFKVYKGERALENTLIYQGSATNLEISMDKPDRVWFSRCNKHGCDDATPLLPKRESATKAMIHRLTKAKRSLAIRRSGRRLQAQGVRYVGAVTLDSEFPFCAPKTLPIGATVQLKLPGVSLVVTNTRIVQQKTNWTWTARNQSKNLVVKFSGRDCDQRPYGSIRTPKGSYWLRPLDQDDAYAVYRMKY